MTHRKVITMAIMFALLGGCSSNKEKVPEGFAPSSQMQRANVPANFKWKLEDLFATDESWASALDKASKGIEELKKFKGSLGSPEKIRTVLEFYFPLSKDISWIALYANLQQTTDQNNGKYIEMKKKALALMSNFLESSSFVREEILASDPEMVKAAITAGPLKEYRPFIDEFLRRRSRVLSPGEEKILAMAGDNLWAIIDINELPSGYEQSFQAMSGDLTFPEITDENGKTVQLTLSNYGKYRSSANREVRKSAVSTLFGTLKKFQNLFASTLAGQVQTNIFFATARGYQRAMYAYLDKENVSPAVYNNLIETTHRNLDKLHRYIALRKKLMKLDDIHIYDLYVPMLKSAETNYSYTDAKDIILKGLQPLGSDYVVDLKKGMDIENGWLDLYPNEGKDSGASCNSVYGTHPYLKMNYFGEYDDVSTLAHEYGHAMHSYYSMKNQPQWTASYATFLAETASTTNETLLLDQMIANAKSKEEKLFFLNERLENIRTTIYRQTLFAEFEKEIHELVENGTPLTAEILSSTYKDLVKLYYGDELTIDENDGLEWAYIPHFYYKFYVYNYATGLSSGIAFAKNIKDGGIPAAQKYIKMLSSGSSKAPLVLMKEAGVDMSNPAAIQSAFDLFDETLTEMERMVSGDKTNT